MAKQVIYSEQKFWVIRSNGWLYFYDNKHKPANSPSETGFLYRFSVDSPDFLPFVKSGEKPSLCMFRAVNVYNFNIRVNVERGIATRNRSGELLFKSVSATKQDYSLICYGDFLPIVTDGSLYNIEIRKLR